MKVALVQMPVWWTIDPPLGLAQMAGCLKAAGHAVSVFDLNILLWKDRLPQYNNLWLWEQFHFWNYPDLVDRFFEDNRERIEFFLESILRTDAPVIGFSVQTGSQLPCLKMASLIKKADPARRVVFGGQYFFMDGKAEEVLAGLEVDAVVRGAADDVFPRLVADVERTGRIMPRPGVVLRGEGVLVDGGPSLRLLNLDQVPFADFTQFPLDLYTDSTRIPFAASRGCVWACRFCSTREFWSGYSYMSGDRIFAEILHHRRLFPSRTHIDFYDITANGRPESLGRFSRLVIHHHRHSTLLHIGWKINAILRPEMTAELLRDLYDAGCMEIIYGVESGSHRVLKLMNKNYNISVAERVLRETHAAGITTTGNFMFGFPGETEDDFQMTLDFLRRNAASLDKAYASATFTSLEENSYLTTHQEEFRIQKATTKDFHSLYWQSEDGANTYPVRMDRYVRFRQLAIELGLEAYKGINGDLEQERLSNLAQYHFYSNNWMQAIDAYLDYLRIDPHNQAMRQDLRSAFNDLLKLTEAWRAFLSWRDRHLAVPCDVQKEIWDRAHEWLTDDKPFDLPACPRLQEWLERNPAHASFVKDLIDFHGALQGLRCHAFLRWEERRGLWLHYGKDPIESSERLAAVISAVEAKLSVNSVGLVAVKGVA